jgi:hypothetical protein
MKGIVFNLFESIVVREHGDDTWDALLDSAGLEGAYTSLGNYPDDDLMSLVRASPERLGLPDAGAVLRWFGRRAIPVLADRYPAFFQPQHTTREFVLTLNEIIHPEVRNLYPGADVPVFDFDTSSPTVLVMGYRSKRRLCALAHGFVEGAGDYYGEAVTFTHVSCMHAGDEKCVFEISAEVRPV